MTSIEFLRLEDVLAIHKRTGTMAALVFLDWNGLEVFAEPGKLADLTLSVTAGERTKLDVAKWFEDHHSSSPP